VKLSEMIVIHCKVNEYQSDQLPAKDSYTNGENCPFNLETSRRAPNITARGK